MLKTICFDPGEDDVDVEKAHISIEDEDDVDRAPQSNIDSCDDDADVEKAHLSFEDKDDVDGVVKLKLMSRKPI